MRRKTEQEHQQRVQQFFRQCERDDPETYKRVCEKYPVLNTYQWLAVESREEPVGLLGDAEREES